MDYLQLDKLTDIAYFGLYINRDGTIRKIMEDGTTEPGYNNWENTDGIAAALKDLTLLALARGDKAEAELNGQLLMGIYRTRGQEQEARELKVLLQRGGGS